MRQETRDQHYVWRAYLKRWTKQQTPTGEIWVLHKFPKGKQEPIQLLPLKRIGFEKYYYDVTGFTTKDIELVKKLIDYSELSMPSKISLNASVIAESLFARDAIEKIMCIYENLDNDYNFLDKIINNDLDFYSYNPLKTLLKIMGLPTIDYKLQFNRFFFMQKLRSPNVHDAASKNFNLMKEIYPNRVGTAHTKFFANIMMLYSVERYARNLTDNWSTWIERIENKTEIPFLTSDSPIINMSKEQPDFEMIMYYPISPVIAIKLHAIAPILKSTMPNINIEISNPNDIRILNGIVIANCKNEIFSNEENILQSIKLDLNDIQSFLNAHPEYAE